MRPKLKADSMSPLILNLAMFSKFALSTAVGSFTAKRIKKKRKVMVLVLEEMQNNKFLRGHLVQRKNYLNPDKLKGII